VKGGNIEYSRYKYKFRGYVLHCHLQKFSIKMLSLIKEYVATFYKKDMWRFLDPSLKKNMVTFDESPLVKKIGDDN
jgi:hypothetical protein